MKLWLEAIECGYNQDEYERALLHTVTNVFQDARKKSGEVMRAWA